MTEQQDTIERWVGRKASSADVISPVQVRQMAAALNDAQRMEQPESALLPAGWHWLYFNPIEVQGKLGPDGHPPRGGFLPPVALPRRMWAGSRLRWERAFKVGSTVAKDSEILSVARKSGRSGEMVFVTVAHRYSDAEGAVLYEEHDIVYRGMPSAQERADLAELGRRAQAGEHRFERLPSHAKEVRAGSVLLFRYSATTFNGHRIHYDLPYAREVEGYPGLVVHGPLIATLLLGHVENELAPGRAIKTFEFRAKRPTFDLASFHLHAAAREQGFEVWSTNNVGEVGVDGRIGLA